MHKNTGRKIQNISHEDYQISTHGFLFVSYFFQSNMDTHACNMLRDYDIANVILFIRNIAKIFNERFLHSNKHLIYESFKLHIIMLTLCIIAYIRITLYYCQCQFPSYNFHFLFFQNCIDKRKLTDTVRYSLDIIAYANVILVKNILLCHKRTKENASISYILP